jgi:hypothetical protein
VTEHTEELPFLMDTTVTRELAILAREFERPPYHDAARPDDRLQKAVALIRDGKVDLRQDGTYLVQGRTRTYTCNSECSCPQSQKGKSKWCYHLCAVAIYKELYARLSLPMPVLAPEASAIVEGHAESPQAHEDAASTLDERPVFLRDPPHHNAPFQEEEPMALNDALIDEFYTETEASPADALPQDDPWPGEAGPAVFVSQEQIERSTQIGALMMALARAQARMGNPVRDSTNPHFRTSYPSLAAVRDAVMPPLSAEGIAVLQLPCPPVEGWAGITTGLWHGPSGQYLCATLRLPVAKSDPQGYGSALTYARRYALLAMLNVAGEDEDAEAGRSDTGTRRPTAGAKPGPVATSDAPVLRQEIARILAQLGFQGGSRAEYEAEVLRRTGLTLVAENFAAILAALQTALQTQAA